MYTLLLLLIYLAFISLGLPDSLLGSAWPVIHQELQVPLSYAGAVTMIISFGTICSSLMSERLTKKLGVNIVTVCSVLLTAIALYGFSTASAFWMLCLWGIPYGLGAGAIDAALNNYVALHYNELCPDYIGMAEWLSHGVFSADGHYGDSARDTSCMEGQSQGK